MGFDRKMTARFDKSPGPTAEELAQLPSRLPEGLGGVGMGLGSGGNPLTEVAKNLPQSGSSNGNNQQTAGAPGNSVASATNIMEVVRTLQVAKQLDMMGGNSLGNLAGALTNLSGGNGSMSGGMSGGMSSGMSNSMGNSMMGSAGNMGPGTMSGAGSMGPGTMGAGPMGGTAMGGSSMSGASMSAPMGNTMSSSMGGMSGGPAMSDFSKMDSRSSMNDMGSRGAPSGYSSSTAPAGPSGGPSSGYGRGGMSDSPQMSSSRPFDTIIIRNLPLDCNWQVLREGFSHCGDIKFAEMKEQGSGLIRFSNERDAERAISMMHKQTVAGRVIDVRPY